MSLPARQQRILDQIELIFQARDPRLTALFTTFARLTSHEAMPRIEELRGRLARLLQPIMLIPIVAVVIVSSIVAGSFSSGPRCGAVPIARGYVVPGKAGVCGQGAVVRSGTQSGH